MPRGQAASAEEIKKDLVALNKTLGATSNYKLFQQGISKMSES